MGKKEIQKSEWKHLYPVKKAILVFVWLFLLFVVIAGTRFGLFIGFDLRTEWPLIIYAIFMIVTFKPIWKYVCTTNHSMPFFNQIFTKEELETLLEKEEFTDIIFLKEHGMKYTDVAESEHWLRINRNYVSKEMAILCWTGTQYGSTLVYVLYLTGDIVKIDLGLKFSSEVEVRFGEYMWCKLDIFDIRFYGKEKDKLINDCKKVYRAYVKEQTGISEKEVIKDLIQNSEIPRSICIDKMPYFVQKKMEEYSYSKHVPHNW